MLNKLFFFCILLTSCAAQSTANKDQYKKLNEMLDLVANKEKAMGEVSIYQNGKSVYKKNYGFKAQKINSIYRIGSISKIFTAVMIMKEVERGSIDLNTKLSRFYPKIPSANLITIEHLLRHRSGLVNFVSLPDYPTYAENEQSEQDLINIFIKNGLNFKPGVKHEYSNTGYVLLSFILERLHHKNFSQIFTDEIAKPLGLKSTYIYDKNKPRKNEVSSYTYLGIWKGASNTHQSVASGAGAVVSTSHELSIFIWSLFNGKILKVSTVDKMKDMIDGYGLGLFEIPFRDKKGIGHTGGIDGFVSFGFYFSDSKTVVVNLTNALNMKMNDLSKAVLSSVYKEDFELPVFQDKINLPVAQLRNFEGTYKSMNFPLDIKIFVKDNILFGQATGQRAFNLDAIDSQTFIFTPASLKIIFDSANDELTIIQGGEKNILRR